VSDWSVAFLVVAVIILAVGNYISFLNHERRLAALEKRP
jgi:hypothetical protein